MKQVATSPRIRFGSFEAHLHTGELHKQGLKIRLGRHAFKLLALLLERPGQVRTREEIRQELWGQHVFVNFDQSLNKAVHQLREALGDDAADPHYIETVPERGYKFIYFALALSQPVKKIISPSARVAVLPFASEPANWEMELLNKIILESLIDKLAVVPGLRVLAYSTIQSYRGLESDPRSIGQQLLVPTVVIGDMVQANGQLLLHLELIDARDGTQRWGGQFKQSYAHVLSNPEPMAERVYQELLPFLPRSIGKRTPRIPQRQTVLDTTSRPVSMEKDARRVSWGEED